MYNNKEVFDLTNVVKYCKDVMNKSDDLFGDIKTCIELDGYICNTKKEVLTMLVSRLQRMKPNNFTATEMVSVLGLGSNNKTIEPEDVLLAHCISIIRFFSRDEFRYEEFLD